MSATRSYLEQITYCLPTKHRDVSPKINPISFTGPGDSLVASPFLLLKPNSLLVLSKLYYKERARCEEEVNVHDTYKTSRSSPLSSTTPTRLLLSIPPVTRR